MNESANNYGMDIHCQMMIDEYRANRDVYEKIRVQAGQIVCNELQKNNLYVTAVESRIKDESGLAKKLILKGSKYATTGNLTDIVGLRVITFYNEDVDRVASYVEKLFDVDWSNSVDKRKMHQLDSFGYNSLHYICRRPKELSAYRRQVQTLVSDGNLSEVPLNGDTFKSYLSLLPFHKLNDRIAAINQAEVQQLPMMPFLPLLKELGLLTLGDVEAFVRDNQDDAYKIALSQLAQTDIDIVSSTIGIQKLCIAATLKKGGGRAGLKHIYDIINGPSTFNESLADMVYEQTKKLPFINKK